jgi:hypothetical protein
LDLNHSESYFIEETGLINPPFARLLILGLLSGVPLFGCKAVSKSNISTEAQSLDLTESAAFFAFDGTAITFKDHSTVVTMMEEAKAQGYYYQGANVEGSSLFVDLDKALDQVCAIAKKGNLKKVYVVGYSRGAIAAISFVHQAPKQCGTKIPFAWIGLLDPVNTNLTGKELPTYLPAAMETPCSLVYKENTWEHFVTTVKIDGCNSAVIAVPDVHHIKISKDPRAREALMRSAEYLTNGAIGYSDYLKIAGPAANSLFKPKPLKSEKDALCKTKLQDSSGCLELGCQYDIAGGICFE